MMKYSILLIGLIFSLQGGRERLSDKERNAIFMAQSRAQVRNCQWYMSEQERNDLVAHAYRRKIQQYRNMKPDIKEPSCVESALFTGAVVGSTTVVGLAMYQLYNAL